MTHPTEEEHPFDEAPTPAPIPSKKEEENNNPPNNKDDDKQETNDNNPPKNNSNKIERVARILFWLSYFVGVLWTCLHPVASVLTGESKCRGWYLDEHAIDIKFAEKASSRTYNAIDTKNSNSQNGKFSSLCESITTIQATTDIPNLSCHSHDSLFDMATIVPLSNAIDPVEEAIVFVIPTTEAALKKEPDWSQSVFHAAFLSSLQLLADPKETPWLAKTFLVVSPTFPETPLDDVVSSFLDAYAGSRNHQHRRRQQQQDKSVIPLLPPKLSGAILRNLIVLDLKDRSLSPEEATIQGQKASNTIIEKGKTDLRILPHGRRGVLPNADLVFLMGKVMERAMFLNQQYAKGSTFLVHNYPSASQWVQEIVQELFSNSKNNYREIQLWIREMADLILFAKQMALGPYPPHAAALERGIDSVTLQISFEGYYHYYATKSNNNKTPQLTHASVELVQLLEHLLRALSNLHERLHHSITLYLMPSPRKFVAHVEYLLPNLLLLLPLAIRGLGLVFWDMQKKPKTADNNNNEEIHHEGRLHLGTIGTSLLVTLLSMVMMSVAETAADVSYFGSSYIAICHACYIVLCFLVGLIWMHSRRKQRYEEKDVETSSSQTGRMIQTLQFSACVTAVYILVPIAFAHASLAYVPSLLFTALLAFPKYYDSESKTTHRWSLVPRSIIIFLWLLTSPAVVYLVPYIFERYTVFVRYAYIPLHMQFLLLVLSISS